ncbi:MAG: diadenosine tetraphosphate hydrolase [Nocardioides sp.]
MPFNWWATHGLRLLRSLPVMNEPPDWREDRVESAIDGRNPTVLAELSAAFAVIGDVQFLPGYSLALTKTPGIDRLSDLPRPERLRYLADVDLLADAVETVCRRADAAYRRLNVEILGNTDAFLHCHIWPRYEWEPSEIIGKPVWLYDPVRWRDPANALGPAHDEMRAALTAEVVSRRGSAEFRFNV